MNLGPAFGDARIAGADVTRFECYSAPFRIELGADLRAILAGTWTSGTLLSRSPCGGMRTCSSREAPRPLSPRGATSRTSRTRRNPGGDHEAMPGDGRSGLGGRVHRLSLRDVAIMSGLWLVGRR
jgi:hypothetical protein